MRPAPRESGVLLAPGYEAIAHLSRGRRLDVYDAWDSERGCRCIVKAVRPDRRDDPRVRHALLVEGTLICGLNHPHLVRGYEVLREPEPLVVMETLSGQTLDHMLETEGPLMAPDIAQLGVQLGSAIRYLHRHEVLHLDLKPSNLVVEAGRAKVIDFSVARPPGPAPRGVGTWCYLSPEQAEGGVLGFAADMWGVGAVLFEAAVGFAPFEDDVTGDDFGGAQSPQEARPSTDDPSTDSSAFGAFRGPWPQLEGPADRIDALRDLPVELADLVAECLDPVPARRPSVGELLARLEPICGLPEEERRWATSGAATGGHEHDAVLAS